MKTKNRLHNLGLVLAGAASGASAQIISSIGTGILSPSNHMLIAAKVEG